jgi:hypothetical protein
MGQVLIRWVRVAWSYWPGLCQSQIFVLGKGKGGYISIPRFARRLSLFSEVLGYSVVEGGVESAMVSLSLLVLHREMGMLEVNDPFNRIQSHFISPSQPTQKHICDSPQTRQTRLALAKAGSISPIPEPPLAHSNMTQSVYSVYTIPSDYTHG